MAPPGRPTPPPPAPTATCRCHASPATNTMPPPRPSQAIRSTLTRISTSPARPTSTGHGTTVVEGGPLPEHNAASGRPLITAIVAARRPAAGPRASRPLRSGTRGADREHRQRPEEPLAARRASELSRVCPAHQIGHYALRLGEPDAGVSRVDRLDVLGACRARPCGALVFVPTDRPANSGRRLSSPRVRTLGWSRAVPQAGGAGTSWRRGRRARRPRGRSSPARTPASGRR